MTSELMQSLNEKKIWLQIVPLKEVLDYWLDRLQRVLQSSSVDSEQPEFLPLALCYVMLAHQYILLQDMNSAKAMQQKFMGLLGRAAVDKLWSYITCCYKEDLSDMLNQFVEQLNIKESISVLYFVTIIFMTNEAQISLCVPKRPDSWDWFWLAESSRRLAKICLKRNELGPEMTACVRFKVGSLLLDCAVTKDIDAHKYLLKAFSHYQCLIERQRLKGLTRRIDAEIISNEQSMVAIVNMASCFLQLRHMDKCSQLINQARSLLSKSLILDKRQDQYRYFSAFVDYVDGVNQFERTSPLHSKLNAGSATLCATQLNKFYDEAFYKLTCSAQTLRQFFPNSAILASVLTMLGIVTANKSAEFNEISLAYLQEAVQVEIDLSFRSNTRRYLLQILSIASGFFESDDTDFALQWKRLYNEFKSAVQQSVSGVKEEASPAMAAVSEVSLQSVSVSTSSSLQLLPTSAESEQLNPLPPLVEFRFTDCYRQDCLNYFKRRLRECVGSESTLAAALCRLFIGRFHLLRCAVNLARQEQTAVRELLLEKFSFDIVSHSHFTLSQLRNKLRADDAEMTESVAICCAFWQANQAKLLLLNLQLGNNWRLNRISPAGSAVHSARTGRYIKQRWHSFSDSVLLRFWADDWSSARRLMMSSRKLSDELRQSFKANTDWSHLGAVLDCSLAEICVDLNQLLPSKTLRSRQIEKCAKSVDTSLRNWLAENFSDSALALAGHRVAILEDEFDELRPDNNETEGDGKVCASDDANVELRPMPCPPRRLLLFQKAYDSCAAAGLIDSPLHAYVQISVAVILYLSAINNLTKPAYSMYNAAVLKLRQAARAMELLEPMHPLTGDCYALLAVMYYNMMQLEDQEQKAMSCLRACLRVQRSLVANGCATSRWSWRCIDVARKLAVYFSASDKQSEWSDIVREADAILEISKHDSQETRIQMLGQDENWSTLNPNASPEDRRPIAEDFLDPIIAWEGKQHLRETCEAMRGRVYPKDNLPTYTEIMCYSHYLMKLWNEHETICDYEWMYVCVPKCRMKRTSNDMPRRNDFLNGLNEYTLAAPRDKQKILRRLQINHEQMLRMCKPAQLFDAAYGREEET